MGLTVSQQSQKMVLLKELPASYILCPPLDNPTILEGVKEPENLYKGYMYACRYSIKLYMYTCTVVQGVHVRIQVQYKAFMCTCTAVQSYT